jgi:hypothetical protein
MDYGWVHASERENVGKEGRKVLGAGGGGRARGLGIRLLLP